MQNIKKKKKKKKAVRSSEIFLSFPVILIVFLQPSILSLLAQLPESPSKQFLELQVIKSAWNSLPHPPTGWATFCGPQYRSADGSGNNAAYPDIGIPFPIIYNMPSISPKSFV